MKIKKTMIKTVLPIQKLGASRVRCEPTVSSLAGKSLWSCITEFFWYRYFRQIGVCRLVLLLKNIK